MNDTDTLVQLLQLTSKLSTQVESMDERMRKIESVVSNDIRQDERITTIEDSLKRGSAKFKEIEARLKNIENADGEKAKTIVRAVLNYALSAGAGFLLAALSFYITNKK